MCFYKLRQCCWRPRLMQMALCEHILWTGVSWFDSVGSWQIVFWPVSPLGFATWQPGSPSLAECNGPGSDCEWKPGWHGCSKVVGGLPGSFSTVFVLTCTILYSLTKEKLRISSIVAHSDIGNNPIAVLENTQNCCLANWLSHFYVKLSHHLGESFMFLLGNCDIIT